MAALFVQKQSSEVACSMSRAAFETLVAGSVIRDLHALAAWQMLRPISHSS